MRPLQLASRRSARPAHAHTHPPTQLSGQMCIPPSAQGGGVGARRRARNQLHVSSSRGRRVRRPQRAAHAASRQPPVLCKQGRAIHFPYTTLTVDGIQGVVRLKVLAGGGGPACTLTHWMIGQQGRGGSAGRRLPRQAAAPACNLAARQASAPQQHAATPSGSVRQGRTAAGLRVVLRVAVVFGKEALLAHLMETLENGARGEGYEEGGACGCKSAAWRSW